MTNVAPFYLQLWQDQAGFENDLVVYLGSVLGSETKLG